MARQTREDTGGVERERQLNGGDRAAAARSKSASRRRGSKAAMRLEDEKRAVARDELDRIVEIYGQPKPTPPALPWARPETALEDARRRVREDLSILRHGSRTVVGAAFDLGRTPLRLWRALRLWRQGRALRDGETAREDGGDA